ncbi:MAG: hypothetical protein RIQ79_1874 [Verrucomicrobiota bacterium]
MSPNPSTLRDCSSAPDTGHLVFQGRRLQLLNLIAAANQASSVEAVLRVTVDELARFMGCPVGHAFVLAEGAPPCLVSSGVWSLATPERFAGFCAATTESRLAPACGLFGDIARTGRPVWVRDLKSLSGFHRAVAAEAAGLRAVFAFPVISGGEVVGVLEFFHEAITEPDARLVEISGQIGALVGRVFERQSLEHRLLELNRDLERRVIGRTAELSESLAGLADFLENANDLIQSVDTDGRYRFVNRAWCETLGYTQAEAENLNMFGVIDPSCHEHCRAIFMQLMRTASPMRIETVFRTKAGRQIQVEGSINLRFEDDRPSVTRGVFRDITESKRAERALRESEARYRLVVDNLKEVVFQTDAEGRWLLLNPAWTEITGHAVADSLGCVFLDYVHPDDRARNSELFRPLIAREKDYCRHEIRYLTRGGGFRWIEVFARLTLDDQGNAIGTAGTLADVTERRQAAAEIEKLLIAVDAATDGIARLNAVGEYTHLNRAHVEMFGFEQETELLGRTWREIYHADEIARIEGQVFQKLGAAGSWRGSATAKRRDGTTFPQELSLTLLPDGGLVCICRDVTKKARAEQQLIANLAREKELNELKAHFVSMASHELRTPLATLSLGVDFLHSHWPRLNEAQIAGNLATVREGVKQLRTILDDLLLLGQADEGRMQAQPVSLLVGELLRKLAGEAGATDKDRHPIQVRCEPAGLQASVDPQLVRHIVLNLVGNACKYSEAGRPVGLSASARDGRLELGVVDHGIGIPAEDQARLFSAFFRARNVGGIEGSGLGLAVVRRCVEAHRGTIDFVSTSGEGTCFTVTLSPMDAPL